MHENEGGTLVASWKELRHQYGVRVRASEQRAEQAEDTVRQLQSQLRSTEARLETTEAQLHATEGRLETTEAHLHATEGRLETTEAQLHATEGRLETTKEKVVSLARRLQALHSKAKARVSRAESQVQALKDSLLSWMTRAQTAETRLAQAEDRINALCVSSTALESEWTAALGALSSSTTHTTTPLPLSLSSLVEGEEGDREEILYDALVRAGEEVAELRSRTVWKEVSTTQTTEAAHALKEALLDAVSDKARLQKQVAGLREEVDAVRASGRVDVELATFPYRQYVAQMEEEVERARAKVAETQAGAGRMGDALDEAKQTIAGQRLAMAFLRKRARRADNQTNHR